MSLDLLIQPTVSKDRRDFKPVSPTLLVGIGGTGKEILLRFRRLIVERYGSLSALPFVQFVHLDTDRTRAAKEQYDLKSEDDPLYSKILFQPVEQVNLTIEGGTGKYVENINQSPNIKRWFETKGKIAGMGDLGQGAGQFRMASRLGFFHPPNFESLSSRLDRVGGLLRDAANQQKASDLNFQLAPDRIEIVVAASLAGGTGGGVFLDMGYLLSKMFPGADRIGVFLLPNFYRGYAGAGRARANGYAALTELNFYSFGHYFTGDWNPHSPDDLPPPPFTNTYLIDATNEAGLEIGSSGKEYDIYRMVAEYLFQDFSIGSFSGMKRATRVNLEQFNLNVFTHNFLNIELETRREGEKNLVGDTYPTRFSSFGLATISFPTDRVHAACACRLAREILKSWETTLLEDPMDRLITSILIDPEVSFFQGRYEKRDGSAAIEERHIEDALLWYDENSGKTFTNYIWERAQGIRGEIEASPKGQKGAVLAQHRNQLDQLMAKEDAANSEDWGQWVRTIEDNLRHYKHKLEHGLRKKAEEVANNRNLGVAVALSMLRELKLMLRNDIFWYLKYFEDNIESWQGETTRYSAELDRLQMDIEQHDRQRLFRKADIERDIELLVAADADEGDLGVIYNYLYSRVMKQVSKRGKYICEEIDKFLGKDDPTGKGLIAEYYQLLGGFHKLASHLEEKERYFSRETRSELNLSLYRPGDVDEWYRLWVGEPSNEAQVFKRVGNEMLSSIFGVNSVTQALEYIQETKTEEVEDQVFVHCKRFFAHQEEQPQVLKILQDGSRFSHAENEEKIRLAYNLGKVWLSRAKRGLDHTTLSQVKGDQRPCLIGVDTNDKARFKEFQELVGRIQSSGDSPPSFLNIGEVNRGMIVFYNELAGVPAFYGDSVSAAGGLKESYQSYRDKSELHTDRNRFQFGELIPKTNEEAKKYADSVRAFVLARLLGLLKIQEFREEDLDKPTFRYSYRKSDMLQVEEVDLGDELSAIDVLYRDPQSGAQSDRAQLLQQVEEVLETLGAHRLISVYALLIDFYKKMVYPPTTAEGWVQDLTINQFAPEYAVLEEATHSLKKLLPEAQDRKQLRVALEKLRGKKVGDLTYDEYYRGLEPYCKPAGKFSVTKSGPVRSQRTEYLDAWALDLSKVDQRFKEYGETKEGSKPAPRSEPMAVVPTRPCPNCGEVIDTRAVFCKHCKETVAQHVTCLHCEEHRVPDDLDHCWNCGRSLPRLGEKIECQRCFDFTGYEHEFPCPKCGYDPDGEPEPEERTAEAEVVSGPIPMAEPAQEAPDEAQHLVECPNCFEQVEAGPICPVCGRSLEAG